ncbi:MAG: hypothetical protein H7839_10840 [Magnetococcus sp. YQC-5]
MTQAVTLDDMWKMFQESDRKFQEMVQEMIREDRKERERRESLLREEMERREALLREEKERREALLREEKERWERLDRKFEETDRRMQETDRRMQETDRLMQETDRRIKDTDRQMKETDRKIGQLGGRLGEFVEGMVAPACKTLFAQRGIPVHKVSRRVEADLPGGRHMEIDLFVVNTDSASLVEVKSKLTIEDVRDHITHLGEFKEFFPEYADKRVFGAVAGMVVDENVIRFAIKNGLFVIVQAGDQVCLANDDTFVPREW